jgi:enamine deaminase RidA (YjgF/YER057c/UK114 family)
MKEIYAGCFGELRPARTAVAVKGLPCGALIEIECVAKFAESGGK